MRRVPVIILIILAILAGAFLGIRDADIPYSTLVERYGQPPSQFIELDGGLVAHYREQGTEGAPVLLLLHGSNASLYTWEPWVRELSDEYRVVTLDLLGHGLSALSPGHDYSQAAYEKFLHAFVKAKGLETFTLAGNSMGGGIAWRYALAHPERLEALVLLDASGIPRAADEEDGEALIFKIARTPGLNKLLLHVLPRSTVKAQLLDAVAVDEVVTEEMVTRYHAFLLREGRRAATMARMNGGWEKSPVDRLGEIKVPTLILWGAEDTWVPVFGAHVFAAEIPDATLILYEGVGHLPMEEVPTRSAADLKSFLDSQFGP